MSTGSLKRALVGFAVAATSVAVVAGPAFATKNTGGYQRSSEGLKTQWVDPCPGIWSMFEKDVNSAQTAHDAGNTKSMLDFLDLANNDLKAGQMAGCDWAAEAAVPQYPSTTVVGATPTRALY